MIFYKLKYVMHPKMREEAAKELRNCKLLFPPNYFLMQYRGFMGTSSPLLGACFVNLNIFHD